MKLLLDIKEDKAGFVMELLKNLRFVKVTPLTGDKERIYTDWKEAMDELKLIKAGQKRGRPVEDLLNGH
jgi:hypothetical protein